MYYKKCAIHKGWCPQSSTEKVANALGVHHAPLIGIMTEDEIVEYVKSKPLSLCSQTPQVMEGVICRPVPMVILESGEPLMMKLKCREF